MKFIPKSLTTGVARQVLAGRHASPKMLFVVGIAGVVGSSVLACRATLKVEDLLSQTQHDLLIAHSLVDTEYSELDRTKDIAVIYTRSAVKLTKLYTPSILLGAASIAALTKSHNTLTQRNIALTAAYAALEKGFNEYRERVVEKYGEEEDRDFRYANEKVKVHEGKKKVTRAAPGADSIYARFFDRMSPSWDKNPEFNLVFLMAQQNYANNLLHARGHVFLNEVYGMLGIEQSSAGQIVGWVMGGEGDNFIDFGVFEGDGASRDFVNGREGAILLDFNVDGVVWEKIDEYKRGGLGWQS